MYSNLFLHGIIKMETIMIINPTVQITPKSIS